MRAMHPLTSLLALVTAASATLWHAPAGATPAAADRPQLAARTQAGGDELSALSKRVNARFARLAKGKRPGAVVALVRNDALVHVGAYGYANVAEAKHLSADTVFDLASVSKQMTAMAIALLIERGQVRLSDPLTKWYPNFPAYARRITVAHLVGHTDGLRDYMALHEDAVADGRWNEDFEPSSDQIATALSRVARPEFPAGKAFAYSNSAYVMLGRIVARASGMPFADFMRRELFEPLGMRQARVIDGPPVRMPTHALGYDAPTKKGWPVSERSVLDRVAGDGNVHATVDDVVRWTRAYQPGVILKARTLAMVTTPFRTNAGASTDYGFGIYVQGKPGPGQRLSHDGSWGGFATGIVMTPGRRNASVVLSNAGELDALAEAEALLKLLP